MEVKGQYVYTSKMEQIWLIDHTNHNLYPDFHTWVNCFTSHPDMPSFEYSKRRIRQRELVNDKNKNKVNSKLHS